MTPSELARKMADAGASTDAIIIALEALDARDAVDEERRARARDRKRRSRDKTVTVTGQDRDECGAVTACHCDVAPETSSPKESPPTPPKEITLSPSSLRSVSQRERAVALAVEFKTDFWPHYPHKVGRDAAAKAYLKARLGGYDLTAILEGLAAYVASKPADRSWMNPATFLNGRRWLDEVPATSTGPPRPAVKNARAQAMEELFGKSNESAFNGETIDGDYAPLGG